MDVTESMAADNGQRHAAVYDRIYGARFAPDAALEALTAAAGDSPVLELGVGTGRLAIPLAQRGVVVDGIEASPAMIARLATQPGSDTVGVIRADLADFTLGRSDYAVAVCAVSTCSCSPTTLSAAACARRPPICGPAVGCTSKRSDSIRAGSTPTAIGKNTCPQTPAARTWSAATTTPRPAASTSPTNSAAALRAAPTRSRCATPPSKSSTGWPPTRGLRLAGRWQDRTGTPARAQSSAGAAGPRATPALVKLATEFRKSLSSRAAC